MQTARVSFFAALLLALLLPPVQAQFAQLSVLNPQVTWNKQQASIDEATLVVRPKGLFFQHDLYLTFSAQGTGFQQSDTLEVEFLFDLPEEAAFIDSWLWIEDKIIRAELMDSWTASNIYENIVRRRRDPSILFKRSARRYELRIYPMAKTETRKVRLSYLMPADWSSAGLSGALPGHLISAARFKPEALKVVTYQTALWHSPHFPGYPNRAFTAHTDTVRGDYEMGALLEHEWGGTSLSFEVPIEDGLFMSQFVADGEGWYQLALMPDALFPQQHRKVLVLLDHEASSATVTMPDLIGQVRSALMGTLAHTDSFAVVVSRAQPERITPGWTPASAAQIDEVLDRVAARPPASYSTLPTLLAEGLEFLDDIRGGAVLVVTSATSHGDLEAANGIIAELRRDHNPLPPLHFVDAAQQSVRSHWIAGRWYRNNEYLYLNLAQLSAGSLALSRDASTLNAALGAAVTATGQQVNAFDLYVEVEGGYTYGRRSSYDGASRLYAAQPIYQVGRFRGTAPFRVRASGLIDGTSFSRDIVAAPEGIVGADSTLRTFWHAQQIQALEADAGDDKALNAQVVQLSLDQRVLSLFTAFLALEPGQGGTICVPCYDESANLPISVDDDQLPRDVELEAFPNPFREAVTLRIRLREAVSAEEVRAEVYDVLGRLVRRLSPEAGGIATEHVLRWNGKDEAGAALSSGTYLIAVTTPAGRHTLPVVRVR